MVQKLDGGTASPTLSERESKENIGYFMSISSLLPNIVWLIPDSVRVLPGHDTIGRLSFMDDISKEAIEYTRMYTTAPSTTMSFMSLFTGVHSVFLSDNYQAIKDHRIGIPTICQRLEQAGYNMYFFSWLPHLRETHDAFLKIAPLLNSREEFDRIFIDSYCGAETKKAVEDFLSSHRLQEPFCFFYHASYGYGIPIEGYDYSADIKRIYELIEKQRSLDDAIVLMHSDHGYPIYRKDVSQEQMWAHDLLMTEENIRVPFFLKYPQGRKNTKITLPCSLLDVYPTLCSLLGIDTDSCFLQGRSILPDALHGSTTRHIRIDNRFSNQPHRITALVNDTHKLLFHHDEDRYEIIKIAPDCSETLLGTESQEEQVAMIAELEKSDKEGLILGKQVRKTILHNAKNALAGLIESHHRRYSLLLYCDSWTVQSFRSILPENGAPLATVTNSPEFAQDYSPCWKLDEKASQADISALSDTLCKLEVALAILVVPSVTTMNTDDLIPVLELAGRLSCDIAVIDKGYTCELIQDRETYFRRKQQVFVSRRKRDARRATEREKNKDTYFNNLKQAGPA